jgi:chaperonin GroES
MGFKPLHDRVVVSRFSEETKTAGGIILPDTAQEKPSEGTVVAVGNGIRGDDGSITPLDVKKGDHVLFGKFGGTEIKVDGEELMILRESDILGIIENPGKKSK